MNSNMLCSRCHKRLAVIYMTRMENGQTINEGLCLKCARELGLKPVDDMMERMGLTDEDIDNASDQMMELMGEDGNGLFEQGGAMPFPFLQNIFNAGDQKAPEDHGLRRQDDKQKKEGGRDSKEPQRPRYKFLEGFCENLNEKAAQGRMDPVIGREEEIYRVIQILNRRTKNNPCLIGEPGVGKTAIAEGIAQRIVAGQVPAKLADKEIFLLDLTGLVAGTQFRGQFESRVKGLVEDVKKHGKAILFIDEVHTLVGVGDSEGSMNAANILKPALSRGEIQVIGATTFNEYRKNIEKDAALERRFQTVKVAEPTISDAIQIIKGVRKYYESYHRVAVSDQMAERAVVLAERYINDRFLPDKAIDLLDEACSCAALENKELAEYDRLYKEKVELDQKIADTEKQTEVDYEALAGMKAQAAQMEQQLSELSEKALNHPITEDDFARVIELWTGIPASKIKESEVRRVADLEENLSKKIIGQQEAINTVSAAVRRSRVRISPKKRPASFIFVGPTGVGKTELVKVLSQQLFDNVEPLIRLDMSEFMEKHSVSRIIGSPPGYVGYDEAGQLTEKVRRRPYSIVLLDEIEKAHPDVTNILLQILDEGHITDAQGRDVSFENTIIVMTSNAGSQRKDGAMGFNKQPYDAAKDKALTALRDFLRPEFLARVDEVVVFRPLDQEDFRKIARLMADELKPGLLERGVHFDCSDEALEVIAAEAYGHRNGARDIRKELRRTVEDPICLMLAEHPEDHPALMKAVVKDGKIVIETA